MSESHLRWAEELWFREVLLGEPGSGRGFGPDAQGVEDAEFRVRGMPLAPLLEEPARHAGHLDLVREMLDGDTGYY